jgi:serine/threonine protein kinase
MKNNKGGRILASGGYGCVFSPALKCEGEKKREVNKISKLMTEKHATSEYNEIIAIKEKIDKIPHFEDYFLLYDATLCKPAKLTEADLTAYASKCTALPKDNITKKNINENLDKLMSLNIPNGGLPIDDFLYEDGTFEKLYKVHNGLFKLLKKGIVPMNKKNVYHCDIKDSNILTDGSKTRLIDWGLSTEYTPFKSEPFPKTWRNRPFQFNVPFSVIIFSDSFVEKYTKYLKDGGKPEETELKPFVLDFINFWLKERGPGHYKFINEIMFSLFHNSLTTISKESKPQVIETQITMNYIVNYIINVLVHFTKFKPDGSLNLRDYLDNVFIEIVDVWGFITAYYPIIEILSDSYDNLTKNELKIFNQLQFIFVEYLYNPRHEPIDMNMLYSDLKDLAHLFNIKIHGKKKTSSVLSVDQNLGLGIHKKTRKQNKKFREKSSILFNRKSKEKNYKNPIFLSLK